MKALKRNPQGRAKGRGVALVIALLLLAVLTMLAGTGVRMSVGEMWMAANEQFHRQAVEAASAGIEVAVARIVTTGGMSAVRDGTTTQSFGSASELTVAVQPAASESMLVGSSAGRWAGEHFEIESVGTSSRGARDVQVQGVMVVSATGGVMQFSRIGSGLSDGGAP
jgi:type II secretory pathway component PulK